MAEKTEAIKQAVESTFVEKTKQVFKESLHSILLYGSYVEGNFKKDISDINVLIILNKSEYSEISTFGKECAKLIKKYNITPLLLRKQEFLNSADVFPMEYMDLVDRYKLLFGEDITGELDLSPNNLRHQLEYHLRGNVNSLRQLITASKGKTRVLGKNLKTWFGSFLSLFRGLLRLKGVTPIPHNGEDVLLKMKEEFSFDSAPFQELLDYRNGGDADVETLASKLLTVLQDLVSTVDSMES
jgi:predicted nucleotidyltransferase